MSWLLGGNRGALFLAASLEVLSEWESKGLGWLFVYGFAPNQADFQHQATIQSQGKWLFVFKIFGHWEAGGGGGGAAGGLGKTAENEEKSRREQEPFEHLLYSVHHVGQIHPVSGWLSIAWWGTLFTFYHKAEEEM